MFTTNRLLNFFNRQKTKFNKSERKHQGHSKIKQKVYYSKKKTNQKQTRSKVKHGDLSRWALDGRRGHPTCLFQILQPKRGWRPVLAYPLINTAGQRPGTLFSVWDIDDNTDPSTLLNKLPAQKPPRWSVFLTHTHTRGPKARLQSSEDTKWRIQPRSDQLWVHRITSIHHIVLPPIKNSFSDF